MKGHESDLFGVERVEGLGGEAIVSHDHRDAVGHHHHHVFGAIEVALGAHGGEQLAERYARLDAHGRLLVEGQIDLYADGQLERLLLIRMMMLMLLQMQMSVLVGLGGRQSECARGRRHLAVQRPAALRAEWRDELLMLVVLECERLGHDGYLTRICSHESTSPTTHILKSLFVE